MSYRLTPPHYFGGMILSNIDIAYNYEKNLLLMLKHRYQKYSSNWKLFVSMNAMAKHYKSSDFHPMPSDPLLYFPEDLHYICLRMKRKKLKLLVLKCLKYYNKHKYYFK